MMSDVECVSEWKLEAFHNGRTLRASSLATTVASQNHLLPDVQELLEPHTLMASLLRAESADDLLHSMLNSSLPCDSHILDRAISTLLYDTFAPQTHQRKRCGVLDIPPAPPYPAKSKDHLPPPPRSKPPKNSISLFDKSTGDAVHACFADYRDCVLSSAIVDRSKQNDASTRSAVLADFRAGRLRLTSLFQIKPYIAEFARDQAGGRFIQQRLIEGPTAEKQLARQHLMPAFKQLATDAVGNHVLQKLFETGTPKETCELFKALKGDIVRYTLHTYGCRVLQKALQALPLKDAILFADELRPHVIRCVEDQNGNHVIQKCVERLPFEHTRFIINAFNGQVARVATHCYGCRVVQRILEHSPHCQIASFLEEIRANFMMLAQDQYGNYVIQHVLRFGQQSDREYILEKIVDNLLVLASHKFSSNVVERCMELKVAPDARRRILKAAFGPRNEARPPIMSMIRDPYANYVVQRILDVNCTELGDELADDVLMRLEKHLPALRKFTYGKHIAAALERLRRQLQERSVRKASEEKTTILQ